MAQLSIVIASLKLIFGTGPKSKKSIAWASLGTRAPNIHSDDKASLSTKAVSPKVHCVQIRACGLLFQATPVRTFGHLGMASAMALPAQHQGRYSQNSPPADSGIWAWHLQRPCQPQRQVCYSKGLPSADLGLGMVSAMALPAPCGSGDVNRMGFFHNPLLSNCGCIVLLIVAASGPSSFLLGLANCCEPLLLQLGANHRRRICCTVTLLVQGALLISLFSVVSGRSIISQEDGILLAGPLRRHLAPAELCCVSAPLCWWGGGGIGRTATTYRYYAGTHRESTYI